MLNNMEAFLRRYEMIAPGDRIVCAVSGGADSMALLFGLYLLKDKLNIRLSAAHFNHHLRGAESDRDEQFVRDFCDGFQIPLRTGSGHIVPGKKGLEAAARDARYAFLRALPGKIATAHTADDNAETVLLHLVRGTGLKGLGAIAPVNGNIIRPMLTVTRNQVEAFLAEYHVGYIQDSSNDGDDFLRNRLRHHVMPLLKEENPRLAENMSAMALRLRRDEEALSQLAENAPLSAETLRSMAPAIRARALEGFLKRSGVKEPEAEHIALAESLVFSQKPSARADFPGGVTIARHYDQLTVLRHRDAPPQVIIPIGQPLHLPDWDLTITCSPAGGIVNTPDTFTVHPKGDIRIRSRLPGDEIRLPGGTKSLKKLFIDRKIPAARRPFVPVIADDEGVLGVYGIGPSLDRTAQALPAIQITLKKSFPAEC